MIPSHPGGINSKTMAKKATKKVFSIGDFVIAKVKGHSPWPAKIFDIPKPGKYVVKFFYTEEIAKTLVEIKPYDVTADLTDIITLKKPRHDLLTAFKQCKHEYEKVMGSSATKENTTESPAHQETENNQQSMEIKHEPQESLQDSLQDLPHNNQETDLPLTKRPRRMKEQSSAIETVQVRTIEKLKEKLQKKLEEKKNKKKIRKERLAFEKAFESKAFEYFSHKFRILIETGEQFLADPTNEQASVQFKLSIKTCENKLGQLSRCVTAVSSDYGRTQTVFQEFHASLSGVVQCLKKVRKKKIKPNSIAAKRLLSLIKKSDAIKGFINQTSNETKEELTVERKENAR